ANAETAIERVVTIVPHHEVMAGWNLENTRIVTDGVWRQIKRVIGLPGDRVQMRGGVLYINDQAVKRDRIGTINNPDVTEQ
ncbi:hypothetical protein F9L03_26480, partial [Brucella lupini]